MTVAACTRRILHPFRRYTAKYRQMWHHIWPNLPVDEIDPPITNGVHPASGSARPERTVRIILRRTLYRTTRRSRGLGKSKQIPSIELYAFTANDASDRFSPASTINNSFFAVEHQARTFSRQSRFLIRIFSPSVLPAGSPPINVARCCSITSIA